MCKRARGPVNWNPKRTDGEREACLCGLASPQAVDPALDLDEVLGESTGIPNAMLREEDTGVFNAQSTIHVRRAKRLNQGAPFDGFADSAHCVSFHRSHLSAAHNQSDKRERESWCGRGPRYRRP